MGQRIVLLQHDKGDTYMKKFASLTVASAAIIVGATSADAQVFEQQKWVIQFNEPPSASDLQSISAVIEKKSSHTVTIPKANVSTEQLKELRQNPNVRFIETVRQRQAFGLEDSQTMWDYTALGLDKFTPTADLEEVVVAVIDTGVDATHPYLEGKVLEGYDEVFEESGGDDYHGHGTHVAGIVARATEGYPVKILPIRVLNDEGFGESDDIAAGIRRAADEGADIINLSLGGFIKTQIEEEAIQYALDKDVMVVVAAGNETMDARAVYPASEENVLTIGAVDEHNELAWFSNYGPVVDVVAPGLDILSTVPPELDYDDEQDGYLVDSGTSMATPFTAGTLAVMRAVYPTLSTTTLEVLLKDHALDLGDVGFDKTFGFGHTYIGDFDATKQAAIIQTTVVNKEAPVLTVAVSNIDAGTGIITVGDETYTFDIIEGQQQYDIELSPVAEAFTAELVIKNAQNINVISTEQTVDLEPEPYTFFIENEQGQTPAIPIISILGKKDGNLFMISEQYVEGYEDGHEMTVLEPDKYEEIYVAVQADNAYYIRPLTEKVMTFTAENLVPVVVKDSYIALAEEPHYPLLELFRQVDGVPISAPINFYGDSTQLFIEAGDYHFISTHTSSNPLYNGLLVKNKVTIDKTYADELEKITVDMGDHAEMLTTVVVDEVTKRFDEEEGQWYDSYIHIKDLATGSGISGSTFDEEYNLMKESNIMLTKGTYLMRYTTMNVLTGDEQIFEEEVTVEGNTTFTFVGEVSDDVHDVRLISEPLETAPLLTTPGIADKEWSLFNLANVNPVYAVHPWQVTLSKPIKRSTVKPNIQIINAYGMPIDVNTRLINADNTILILPKQQYLPQQPYTLLIDEGLESVDGELIYEPVKVEFTAR